MPVSEALSRGLAPDGGLYLAPRLPIVPAEVRRTLEGAPPARVAEAIVRAFLDPREDAALWAALPAVADHAFAPPIPLEPLDDGVRLLELWHGPTGAFKDFAARFLARALALDGVPRHVLVATSGDTGSAVAAAFEAEAGARVTVLFPARGVSSRQAHLLSCFGPRVQSLEVEGTFDDAQRMVKAVLGDPALVTRHRLTSANSISVGRLLPQATWFAWAALRDPGAGFVIPSGNFGHGLAALWARAMGFPVGPVHLATNRNRALVDWFETGAAPPRKSVRTPANAMDVGIPSNLERLQAQVGREPGITDRVTAGAVEDDAILAAVAGAPARWGRIICPHTACALLALDPSVAGAGAGASRPAPLPRVGEGGPPAWIVAGTAHPAKFPEVVEPAVGETVPLPPALAALLARPAGAARIPAEVTALVNRLG